MGTPCVWLLPSRRTKKEMNRTPTSYNKETEHSKQNATVERVNHRMEDWNKHDPGSSLLDMKLVTSVSEWTHESALWDVVRQATMRCKGSGCGFIVSATCHVCQLPHVWFAGMISHRREVRGAFQTLNIVRAGAAVCPSRQLVLSGVRELTKVFVAVLEVLEV